VASSWLVPSALAHRPILPGLHSESVVRSSSGVVSFALSLSSPPVGLDHGAHHLRGGAPLTLWGRCGTLLLADIAHATKAIPLAVALRVLRLSAARYSRYWRQYDRDGRLCRSGRYEDWPRRNPIRGWSHCHGRLGWIGWIEQRWNDFRRLDIMEVWRPDGEPNLRG
jgi:hypothetical protein